MTVQTTIAALPHVFWASYAVLWLLLVIMSVLVFLLYRQHGLLLMDTLAGIERDGPAIGTTLSSFEALSTDGSTVAWQFNSGRPTLVLFAAPACQPCLEIIPHLDDLPELLPTDIDLVTVMAAGLDDNLEGKKPETGFFVLDPGGTVASAWGIRGTPFAIVADEAGTVRAKGVSNNLPRLQDLLRRAGLLGDGVLDGLPASA